MKFNRAQEIYWARKTRRNIILKARQKGISKIIDADQFIDCIRKAINAVIISHEKGATKRLFASVRAFINNLEAKPAVSIDSQSEIKFTETGSSYFIGTAGQKAFGRGDTVDRAHLSEAAFYPNLKMILDGIAEAAEYGQIDIESTANGSGDFKDMWQKAKSGQSSYTAIFIPWFIDDEYSADSMTEAEKKGLSESVQKLLSMDDGEFMKQLNEDETRLIKKAKEEYGIDMTAGQMKWRRYKIWDKGETFFQEYPEDDVSCFLQSGRSVFSGIILEQGRKIRLSDFNNWCVKNKWDDEKRDAFKKKRLYAAVDGAEGKEGGDNHCFSVIDVDMESGKAYVIFEIVSTDPIDIFWEKVGNVCKEFNIVLGIEKNGLGVAHIQKAKQLGIRFKEWHTGDNRPVMISDLEEAYRKGNLIECYMEAYEEAGNMIYNDNNKAEAMKGKHDDRILSRSIAWQMRKAPVAGVSFLDL